MYGNQQWRQGISMVKNRLNERNRERKNTLKSYFVGGEIHYFCKKKLQGREVCDFIKRGQIKKKNINKAALIGT